MRDKTILAVFGYCRAFGMSESHVNSMSVRYICNILNLDTTDYDNITYHVKELY